MDNRTKVTHGVEPQCGYAKAHDYRVLSLSTRYAGRKLECSQCGCVKTEPQRYEEPDAVSFAYLADPKNIGVSL